MATWEKLRREAGGGWAVRCDGRPEPGQAITVTRRDGRRSSETVTEILWSDGRESLVRVRDTRGRDTTAEQAPAPVVRAAEQAPAPVARAAEQAPAPVARAAEPMTSEPDWRALGAPQTAPAATTPRGWSAAVFATPATAIRASEVVAGASADGHGALIGWSGMGELSRSVVLSVLRAAGLSETWAPRAKSATAHAGHAIGLLNHHGYIARRAKGSDTPRGAGRRQWRARWVVAVADASTAEVGEKVGEVVLSVELPSEGDDLILTGSASLAARVRAEYAGLRDAEIYQAGDVTAWLARTLRDHCGATSFGVGYYVPAAGRAVAGRLAAALSARWGAGWICPLLPVATGDELRVGIARGLADDVRTVATALESARKAARAESPPKSEIGPGKAAGLLRDLGAVQDRLAAYRLLCGDAVIAPIVAEIGALAGTLGKLADDASLRFALLDLSVPVSQPAAEPERASPAQRAADAAIETRRAVTANPTPIRRETESRPAAKPAVEWCCAFHRQGGIGLLECGPDTPAERSAAEDRSGMGDRMNNLEFD
jgi:hypothetical protein